MPDTMRGAAAIVGIGELKPERTRPNRDGMSLLAEASYLAIQDAGLTKADIDGMIMEEGMAPTGSKACSIVAASASLSAPLLLHWRGGEGWGELGDS